MDKETITNGMTESMSPDQSYVGCSSSIDSTVTSGGDGGGDGIRSDLKDLENGEPCPPFCVLPFNSTREPFRDIDFLGPITLQRLFVILWLGGTGTGLFFLQWWIWPDKPNPPIWYASPYLGIIWLISLPSAIMYIVGAIMFKHNNRLDDVEAMSHNVVFRIVSRGIDIDCLKATIQKCREEMRKNPLFPYLIEVVTDADSYVPPDEADVLHLKVPSTYRTKNGTLFKARGLNYACERSLIPGGTWVVHLDEETRPTSSSIKGITAFVKECEEKQDLKRIGQGCLLYHRSFSSHPFLTLADMRRTGDDLGYFYLQHAVGLTMFGLHGSFVVCRQDKEAAIGFDIGPRGSITEDSWWILVAMERGYRTKWIDGYLEEQGTQSVMDFLKQRRRWYYGLMKVVAFCPVPWKYKLILSWHVSTWVLSPFFLPFQIAYGVLLLVHDISVNYTIRVLCIVTLVVTIQLYMNGLIVNMVENKMKWWKRPMYAIGMIIVIPVCTLLELYSVLMAFFAPLSATGRGFHVVCKSGDATAKEKDISDETADSRASATTSSEGE